MALNLIDVGTGESPPAAATSETRRSAFVKTNAMFTELYGWAGTKVRTPQNSGLTVTNDGTGDNTAALNSFLSTLATTGDPGFLPPGVYRTTAEVVAPTGTLNLRGVFGASIIAPAANTYNGLRIASGTGGGLGGSIVPRVLLEGIYVRGPSAAPPKSGFAAIVMDGTTQFLGQKLIAEGFDIGYDQINNCYNGTWRDIYTSRNVGTVNCGYNARTDYMNGCDIDFYNVQLTGIQTAMCFSGTGGGYRVFGGSFGTSSTAVSDKYGVVTLGWNYIGDVEAGGLGSIIFSGLHVEGWRGRAAVRAYGSLDFIMEGSGFNPSASDVPATSIYRHTNAQSSVSTWLGNSIGSGTLSSVACLVDGAQDGFNMLEFGWNSNAMAGVNGAGRTPVWCKSLMSESQLGTIANGRYMKGVGFYQDANGASLMFNNARLRPNSVDGTWFQSTDNGVSGNVEPFGRPLVQTFGGTSQNVETWFCPGRIISTGAAANTVNVRTDATANCPTHTKIQIVQRGTGQTTIVPASGVTIDGTPGLKLRAQKSVAWLEKTDANYWIAYGDLSA